MVSELFLKLSEPEVGFDLSKDLSDDPDDWIPEILQHVLTRHPYLRDSLAAPQIEEFDETNLSARGVLIARQGDVVVEVPIIINDGRLAPVDVFLHDGQPYPLTERRMAGVFFNPELGEALLSPPGRLLSRRFTSGLDGVTQELDAEEDLDERFGKSGKETAEELVAWMAGADEAAKEVLGRSITQEPAVFAQLKRHFPDLLSRVFERQKEAADDAATDAASDAATDAANHAEEAPVVALQVEAVGPSRYRVSAWRQGQPPKARELAGREVLAELDRLGADRHLLDEADEHGLVTRPLAPAKVVFAEDLTGAVEKIERTGAYTVYGPAMKARDAYVYCRLQDLDGRSVAGKLVVPVAHDGHGLQAELVGVRQVDSEGIRQQAERGRPADREGDRADRVFRDFTRGELHGRIVTLVYADGIDEDTGHPRVTATEPIEVRQSLQLRGGTSADSRICLQGIAGMSPVSLVSASDLRRIARTDREKLPADVRRIVPRGSQVYAVPDTTRVVVLSPTRLPFADDPATVAATAKAAAERQADSVELTCLNGLYSVELTPGIPAGSTQELEAPAARLVLASLGCEEDVAGDALARAAKHGSVRLYGLRGHTRQAEALRVPTASQARAGAARDPLSSIAHGAGDRLTDREMSRRTASRSLVRTLRKTGAARARLAAYLPSAYARALGLEANDTAVMQPATEPMVSGLPLQAPQATLPEAASSLLSLDFLQHDNVEFFTGKLSLFEQVVSLLGQMLLALRIHPDRPFLEEACVREALEHLEEVVGGLDGLAD